MPNLQTLILTAIQNEYQQIEKRIFIDLACAYNQEGNTIVSTKQASEFWDEAYGGC